jgi:hypothetical protein
MKKYASSSLTDDEQEGLNSPGCCCRERATSCCHSFRKVNYPTRIKFRAEIDAEIASNQSSESDFRDRDESTVLFASFCIHLTRIIEIEIGAKIAV